MAITNANTSLASFVQKSDESPALKFPTKSGWVLLMRGKGYSADVSLLPMQGSQKVLTPLMAISKASCPPVQDLRIYSDNHNYCGTSPDGNSYSGGVTSNGYLDHIL